MTEHSKMNTLEVLERAWSKLNDCTALLENLIDDPEVRDWLPELEGREHGWFPMGDASHEYLADQIYIRILKEKGEAPADLPVS